MPMSGVWNFQHCPPMSFTEAGSITRTQSSSYSEFNSSACPWDALVSSFKHWNYRWAVMPIWYLHGFWGCKL